MDTADIADISSSPAFVFLDELEAADSISLSQAQLYKSKFSKLHEVVLKTYENEKNLLQKAKQLNQELSAERGKLEKTAARAQEDSEAISALRVEVSKGESELGMCEEREMLLQQEVHDLQNVRGELESEISTTQKRQVGNALRKAPHLARRGSITHRGSKHGAHRKDSKEEERRIVRRGKITVGAGIACGGRIAKET